MAAAKRRPAPFLASARTNASPTPPGWHPILVVTPCCLRHLSLPKAARMLAWHLYQVADFGGRLPGPGCLVQGMHAFHGSRRRTERTPAAAASNSSREQRRASTFTCATSSSSGATATRRQGPASAVLLLLIMVEAWAACDTQAERKGAGGGGSRRFGSSSFCLLVRLSASTNRGKRHLACMHIQTHIERE